MNKQTISRSNCDDATYQDNLVSRHKLEPYIIEQYIDNFFGAGNTAYYYNLSRTDLETMMGNYDCSSYYILITGTDDRDGYLLIQRAEIPDISLMDDALHAYYSLGLFRGIFRNYPLATQVHFFKVANGNGENTVAFKVRDDEKVTLYNGNLSGLPLMKAEKPSFSVTEPLVYKRNEQ